MKKTLAVIAAMVIGTAAVVMLGLNSIQRTTPDAPSADDADMRPRASAAGADDAYPDFVKITAALKVASEEREILTKLQESKTPDLAVAEPLIARNAEALALFAVFSRRARLPDPNYSDPDKVGPETPILLYFPSSPPPAEFAAPDPVARAARRRRSTALGVMDAGHCCAPTSRSSPRWSGCSSQTSERWRPGASRPTAAASRPAGGPALRVPAT